MLIREWNGDDTDDVVRLRKVAFGGTSDDRPVRPGRRGLIAELDGRPAAVLAINEHHQFYGGSPVPMGGVGGVAVDPHARGRGVASALLDRALVDLREHGQPLSVLFPTAPPLYRSRGWERAGVHETLDLALDRLPAGPRVDTRPATEADLAALHACYADLASTVNGMLDRSAPAIDVADVLELDIVSVVPGHDGDVRGYLTAERDRAGLRVHDLVGRDRDTQLGLLRGLASWTGLLEGLALRVTDPAVPGLLTNQGIRYTTTTSQWMLRVVDLAAAVGARGWPTAAVIGSAAVDLDVVDEHAPWHAGRRRLVVEGGRVRLEPGGSGAVRVHARALGPWFSGFQDTHALRRAGLLDGDAPLLDLLTGAPGVPRLADFF
ncbi:GNAT family N-acetyltransferase [Saccharothrix obliqua]|uniref:GNAT family N-acetyltransferase n=1 Tax=Saccharothrix obliqua TaxID=2861747 RepID=UPI001C5F9F0E|nr:GNAT family N-acetyltransferase [Saccharothrix obliqua]MBW4719080.1 GNAT family N-acetyltransferase [Saccharothrix obliqua]